MIGTGLAPVIPLAPYRHRRRAVPQPATPEPAQLYNLIVLALVLHTPASDDGCNCNRCSRPWPCPQVRLAFRLREGF